MIEKLEDIVASGQHGTMLVGERAVILFFQELQTVPKAAILALPVNQPEPRAFASSTSKPIASEIPLPGDIAV